VLSETYVNNVLLFFQKLTVDFSLFNLVRDMRTQRVAMVQTKEQYILVHQAVRQLLTQQLQIIDSHHYENISVLLSQISKGKKMDSSTGMS